MKSISKILILLLAITAFASCETEHLGPTINPEAERGGLTFVLNQPQYANFTYELLAVNNAGIMDILTTSQPNFGFTAAVTYFIEISLNEDMSNLVVIGSAQGETVPINVRDMNMGIFNLLSGDMPNPSVAMDIFVRLRAVISTVTSSPFETTPTVQPAFSNVIRLNVLPYFVPNLQPFYRIPGGVFPFFIIGYNGWDNNPGGLLNGSLIPMSVIEGDHYNLEGQGAFEFTGFFEASREFKLVSSGENFGFGNWNIQWGNSGGNGINNPVANDGGSNNFQVPTDGYWTIRLNTIPGVENPLTFTRRDDLTAPRVFDNMGVVGTINDWGGAGNDVDMTPLFPVNNHIWRAVVEFGADEQIKFRYDNDWANNWGVTGDEAHRRSLFPAGIAVPGNANILPGAGNFVVFFNDLDGTYMFIPN